MNFAHLKNAVTTADCGSINKAAAELYISQPCLSNSIKALEEEVGFSIFHRSRGGITLTEKGSQFIEISRGILRDYDRLTSLSDEQNLRALSVSGYPLSYLSDSFLRFHKKDHPELPDRYTEIGNFQVFEEVEAGRVRLGFIFYAYQYRDRFHGIAEKHRCRCEKLFAPLTMYAVAKHGHPLEKYKEITFDELIRYPLVNFSDPSSQKFLRDLGYMPHPSTLYVPDRSLLFDALRSGEYATLMTVTKRSRSQDFIYIPIRDERFLMSIACVMPKIYRPDSRERAFLKFLKQDLEFLG